MPRFLASRGDEFNLDPVTRLDCSELCVIKFHESIKEIEKASDIGIRRGQKEYPYTLLKRLLVSAVPSRSVLSDSL